MKFCTSGFCIWFMKLGNMVLICSCSTGFPANSGLEPMICWAKSGLVDKF